MITAISSEGLTDVERGESMETFCVISVAPIAEWFSQIFR